MDNGNNIVLLDADRPRALKFTMLGMKKFSALAHTPVKDYQTALEDPEKLEVLLYCMLAADARANGEKLVLEKASPAPLPGEVLMDDILDSVEPGEAFRAVGACLDAAFGPKVPETPQTPPETGAGNEF